MRLKDFLVIIFLGILLSSCTEKDKVSGTSENQTEHVKSEQEALNIHLPVVLDSTDYLVYPVGQPVLLETSKRFSYKKTDNYNNYLQNLIFENTATGETQLLTNKNLKIQSFQLLFEDSYPSGDEKISYSDVILYRLADGNTIEKQQYSATYLSKIDGTNFTRISPGDSYITNYKYIKDTNRLYFHTKKKTDADNYQAPIKLWAVDLENFKTEAILTSELEKIKTM